MGFGRVGAGCCFVSFVACSFVGIQYHIWSLFELLAYLLYLLILLAMSGFHNCSEEGKKGLGGGWVGCGWK